MASQPSYNQYKIRRISWNHLGNVYGLTFPREIAEKFLDVKFTITVSGTAIILTSGIDLMQLKKEIRDVPFEVMNGKSV